MSPTPEAEAREKIDLLLEKAGWMVQDARAANIHAAQGVAIREFALASGHGHADYLLYIDGKAAGVIEAKRVGATLSGVEFQSAKYAEGLPPSLPAWRRPLPFLYEPTEQLISSTKEYERDSSNELYMPNGAPAACGAK